MHTVSLNQRLMDDRYYQQCRLRVQKSDGPVHSHAYWNHLLHSTLAPALAQESVLELVPELALQKVLGLVPELALQKVLGLA